MKKLIGVVLVVVALFFGGVLGVTAANKDIDTAAVKDPGTGGV